MPLPFAPPPDESKLYQQLESTTLETLTPDQLDAIRAKTFSQGTEGNEDEYRRLLLLGLASNKFSLSGPMGNTVKTITLTRTTSAGTGSYVSPASGDEVWQFMAGDFISTGGSSTVRLYGKFNDATAIWIASEIGTSGPLTGAVAEHGPLFADANTSFAANNQTAGTDIEIRMAFIRVR
tara:strand:- start:426 stop:962 length:537 start_codon:yes stop_codon:yes gene_type:complete